MAEKPARTTILQYNINIMRFINLWPDENRIESNLWRWFKDISAISLTFISVIAIIVDFCIQINGKYDDIVDITENITGVTAVSGTLYLNICFVRNRPKIMKLVENLNQFEKFNISNLKKMRETDKKAKFYTKLFIIYTIIGNICYIGMPFVNLNACRKRRSISRYSSDIPCGLITRFRLPFRYDHNVWLFSAVMLLQICGCIATTAVSLAITMFLVALLMQIIAQMQQLRCFVRKNNVEIRKCIQYHNAIIEYASNVTKAFSSMMLIHITLTSFEISVLGFEVLMVKSSTDSLRFGMHLFGWLVLLFLVCNYGQKLIDESTGLSLDAYSTEWYTSSVSVQKDLKLMILRSQKPLFLSAASLGIMSLETYLRVMSTAYTYFTLLLNIKNKKNVS